MPSRAPRFAFRPTSTRLLVVLIVVLPGCYRLVAPGPARPTVTNPPHTMTTLAWGLIQDDSLDAICQGEGGIAEVTARTTPLFALATLATLGFWAPVRVETKCLTVEANDARR